jgi:hypothetical protein
LPAGQEDLYGRRFVSTAEAAGRSAPAGGAAHKDGALSAHAAGAVRSGPLNFSGGHKNAAGPQADGVIELRIT